MSGIEQRVHGLTNAMRTPAAVIMAVWSSSKASHSPSTTMLGRKRSIGTGSAPLAFRRPFRSSSDAWLAISSGNPSANPKQCSPTKASARSGCASTQRDTQSGLASRRAAASTLSRPHGVCRNWDSHWAAASLSRRAVVVSLQTPTESASPCRPDPSSATSRSAMPGADSRSACSVSAVRMSAMAGHCRCVMNWPAASTTIQRRSLASPARSMGDSVRSMPAQDLTG